MTKLGSEECHAGRFFAGLSKRFASKSAAGRFDSPVAEGLLLDLHPGRCPARRAGEGKGNPYPRPPTHTNGSFYLLNVSITDIF